MKTIFISITCVVLPALTFGQNSTIENHNIQNLQSRDLAISAILPKTESALASHLQAAEEVTKISYKKSQDLVSIKAYRKSLQIRVKEIIIS